MPPARPVAVGVPLPSLHSALTLALALLHFWLLCPAAPLLAGLAVSPRQGYVVQEIRRLYQNMSRKQLIETYERPIQLQAHV